MKKIISEELIYEILSVVEEIPKDVGKIQFKYLRKKQYAVKEV